MFSAFHNQSPLLTMESRLRQPLCLCHLTNFFFYFLFACLYTYTKLLLIHKEYFGPFSSRHFLIRAIVNLNLTFAVDVTLSVLQWSRMPETELNGKILNFLKAAQWALTTEQIPEIPGGIKMEHEFSGARIHLKRPVSPICSKPFLVSVSGIRSRLS